MKRVGIPDAVWDALVAEVAARQRKADAMLKLAEARQPARCAYVYPKAAS